METRAPSFFAAVVRGLRLSFQFNGRDTRAEFWPFAFICFLIPSLVEFFIVQIGQWEFASAHPNYPDDVIAGRINAFDPELVRAMPQLNPFPWAWITITVAAFLTLPYLAAITRRLHDLEMRGWWAIPQLGLLAAAWYIDLRFARNADIFLSGESFRYMFWSFALYGLTTLWTLMLIYFAVHDGDRGDNRFGPDPKNRILTRRL